MNRREGEASHYKYQAYRPQKSPTWWLRNIKYFLFMMRELSSAFIAVFLLLYLYEFFLLTKGPVVYGAFQESLRTPAFIVFYVVVFVFAVYHAITWFAVVGRVQIVRLGKWRMPPAMVTASAFVGWIAVSIVVGSFLMR